MQPELRLVVDVQGAGADRVSQLADEGKALRRVAVVDLRPCTGPRGPLEQLARVGGVLRGERDTDAGADVDLDIGHRERPPQGREHRPGDHGGGLAGCDARQQDGELVPARARDPVLVVADRPTQALADLPQQRVAVVVAEPVVDLLEPVEVDAWLASIVKTRASSALKWRTSPLRSSTADVPNAPTDR